MFKDFLWIPHTGHALINGLDITSRDFGPSTADLLLCFRNQEDQRLYNHNATNFVSELQVCGYVTRVAILLIELSRFTVIEFDKNVSAENLVTYFDRLNHHKDRKSIARREKKLDILDRRNAIVKQHAMLSR